MFSITQKYNSDNATLEINADQRQQIAAIVGSLLKDAGNLAPDVLVAVAEVNKALQAPEDKPEARHLLGKVWHGLKEMLDATKTTTEITDFVLEHQAAITSAIVMTVAALK
jgi:malate synthase